MIKLIRNALHRLAYRRALLKLRDAIDAELARRDVCEHGVRCGDWCPECREEYRRARREQEGEDE